jgi:hypothetical protein
LAGSASRSRHRQPARTKQARRRGSSTPDHWTFLFMNSDPLMTTVQMMA